MPIKHATDQQGVLDLDAENHVDPIVEEICRQFREKLKESMENFGLYSVYLNGLRGISNNEDPEDPDGVRTQETNLGNLIADANLFYGRQVDSSVVVSIVNGGGIRDGIGTIIDDETRLPNGEVRDEWGNLLQPTGAIARFDIQNALRFNNGLALVTVTRAQLRDILEHGIGALPFADGRFCQVGGLKIVFDPDRQPGSRIRAAWITSVNPPVEIVQNFEISGDSSDTLRLVTTAFLLNQYPFPSDVASNVVRLTDPGIVPAGNADFANPGTEQDALAEYLLAHHYTTPYSLEDTGRNKDQRLQNLKYYIQATPAPIQITPAPIPPIPPPTIPPTAAPSTISPVSLNPFIVSVDGTENLAALTAAMTDLMSAEMKATFSNFVSLTLEPTVLSGRRLQTGGMRVLFRGTARFSSPVSPDTILSKQSEILANTDAVQQAIGRNPDLAGAVAKPVEVIPGNPPAEAPKCRRGLLFFGRCKDKS